MINVDEIKQGDQALNVNWSQNHLTGKPTQAKVALYQSLSHSPLHSIIFE